MALPATDNFNRANGAIGSNWSGDTSVPTIVSNQLTGVAGVNANKKVYWNADSFTAAQSAQLTIKVVDSRSLGPVVRGGATDGYGLWLNSGGIGLVRLNASPSVLWSSGATIPSANDVWKLVVQGTLLSVYRNATLVTRFTDAAVSSGAAGIYISSGITGSWTGAIDDWTGANEPDVTIAVTGVQTTLAAGALTVTVFPPFDDFNRADGALGSNWANPNGNGKIVSNQFVNFNSVQRGICYWNGTFSNNQWAQVDSVSQPSGANWGGGVAVRASGAGASNNGYILSVFNSYKEIEKFTNTTWTQLASTSAGGTGTYKLIANGTSLQAYKTGSLIGSVSDATYAAGAPGIASNGGSQPDAFDNFSGDNYNPDATAAATGVEATLAAGTLVGEVDNTAIVTGAEIDLSAGTLTTSAGQGAIASPVGAEIDFAAGIPAPYAQVEQFVPVTGVETILAAGALEAHGDNAAVIAGVEVDLALGTPTVTITLGAIAPVIGTGTTLLTGLMIGRGGALVLPVGVEVDLEAGDAGTFVFDYVDAVVPIEGAGFTFSAGGMIGGAGSRMRVQGAAVMLDAGLPLGYSGDIFPSVGALDADDAFAEPYIDFNAGISSPLIDCDPSFASPVLAIGIPYAFTVDHPWRFR